MANPFIAIVEDDENDCDLIAKAFTKYGFTCKKLYDVDSALNSIHKEKYSALVLDIELGYERNGGIAILADMIERNIRIPTLIVSGAHDHNNYKDITTKLGAYDYLAKGYDSPNVVVRMVSDLINPITKSGKLTKDKPITKEMSIGIDKCKEHIFKWNGNKLNLPRTQFRILKLFMNNIDKTVFYDDFFEVLPSAKNKSNLANHISNLKTEIKAQDSYGNTEEKSDFNKITNVSGKGYIWVEKIKTEA